VVLISDVRFVNEVDWVQKDWNGWFVHVKKYNIVRHWHSSGFQSFENVYDVAPNEEEAKNDPLIAAKADYHLDWPAVNHLDNLLPMVTECLLKCPFLTIAKQ
jgi:hypothetical protein